jgi:hypothetical protein
MKLVYVNIHDDTKKSMWYAINWQTKMMSILRLTYHNSTYKTTENISYMLEVYNDFGLQALWLLYFYGYKSDKLQFMFLLCTCSKLWAQTERRLEMM